MIGELVVPQFAAPPLRTMVGVMAVLSKLRWWC